MRFLPAAGRLSRRLIQRGYLAVVALALAVGTAYVVSGLSGGVISGGWGARALFAVTVPVLAIFALQDSVLTALRLAPWVPVENVSFAASKIALLPLLVLLPLSGSIVVSWVVPAVIAAVVVNWLLFRRVLPRLTRIDGALPPRRRLMSFVAGEYVGNICTTATVQVMPLLIVWRLGPAAAAYFSLPWLMLMALTLLLWNVASSVVVEIAGAHVDPHAALRRGLLLWGAVALGALVVCGLAAEPLLRLAGGQYAAQGADLLRLIGLSMPFTAVVALYRTLMWLDKRVWMLAALQAGLGAAILGVTVVLLPTVGLAAAGWANLGTQVVGAAVMGPLAVRRLRRGPIGVGR
jgi:O-antigen/teichoic acid export membrane protein